MQKLNSRNILPQPCDWGDDNGQIIKAINSLQLLRFFQGKAHINPGRRSIAS